MGKHASRAVVLAKETDLNYNLQRAAIAQLVLPELCYVLLFKSEKIDLS